MTVAASTLMQFAKHVYETLKGLHVSVRIEHGLRTNQHVHKRVRTRTTSSPTASEGDVSKMSALDQNQPQVKATPSRKLSKLIQISRTDVLRGRRSWLQKSCSLGPLIKTQKEEEGKHRPKQWAKHNGRQKGRKVVTTKDWQQTDDNRNKILEKAPAGGLRKQREGWRHHKAPCCFSEAFLWADLSNPQAPQRRQKNFSEWCVPLGSWAPAHLPRKGETKKAGSDECLNTICPLHKRMTSNTTEWRHPTLF